ncbi:RING-H2 finger protein ATL57 [Glycine soja]
MNDVNRILVGASESLNEQCESSPSKQWHESSCIFQFECRAEALWPLLFLTFMFIIVLITIDHASTGIFIFLGSILGLFLWYWLGSLVLDRDNWDNSHDVDDERTREFQNIESSNASDPQNSLPLTRTRIVIASVRARREPWQDVQPFSFAPRAHAARLSMRALPPAICFQGDDESQRDCPICMEDFKNGELIQPFGVCVHEFHLSCVNSWLLGGGKTTCPVCRKDLSISVD